MQPHDNIPPFKVQRVCRACGNTFLVDRSVITHGGGKYCSKPCQYAPKPKKPNVICQSCGKAFFTKPYRIVDGATKFCSVSCRAVGQVATEETFWSHVARTGECWLWQGGVGSSGYGNTVKRVDGKTISVASHRRAYELTFGEIPAGMSVCHRCDVKRCVRPEHLFLGTTADNAQDKVNKGRQPTGENHGMAQLTESQVLEIRRAGISAKSLKYTFARTYGVSVSTIDRIILGKTWKHILP